MSHMDRRESAINNPYVAKPIMEKFNIDEYSYKKNNYEVHEII